MRNIKRTLMAALAGATVLAGSAFATAAADEMPTGHMDGGHTHEGIGHEGMGGHEFMPPFLHGLQLTEAQQDKVFELTYSQIPALREKHKELHRIHEELRKLALSDNYDDSKAKALISRGAAVMASIGEIMASTDHRIYQLLTAEQKKQLADRAERHAHPSDGGWGHSHHDDDGKPPVAN